MDKTAALKVQKDNVLLKQKNCRIVKLFSGMRKRALHYSKALIACTEENKGVRAAFTELNKALTNYEEMQEGYVVMIENLEARSNAAMSAFEEIKKDDTDSKTGRMGIFANKADKVLKVIIKISKGE